MNFLLSAGEASGDTYGAQLIDALRQLTPLSKKQMPEQSTSGQSSPTFFGMGGEKMRAAGCDLQVHANEVAVVGLVEVVRHLPDIRRRFKHLVAEAARRSPDAAILIDFPDFNLRLARELHKLGIPVFYFVSPQIWAWRTGRVKQIQKYVRKMIVIFPFEREFYRRHGVEVSYVGHPLAYVPQPQISREEFAAQYGLDAQKQWIALLPGSRRKEVRMNLPVMLQAAHLLGRDYEFVLPVASTLSREWLQEQLEQAPGLKPQINSDANAALKGRSSTEEQTQNQQSGVIAGSNTAHSLRSPSPGGEGWGRSSTENTSAAKAGIVIGSDRRPEGLLYPVTEVGKEPEQAPGLKPQINSDLNAALKGRSSTEEPTSTAPSPEGEGAERSLIKTPFIHLTDNARASMLHARASVVASGTATVEAALSGTPFVVVYRLSPLTWILGRKLVKLDTFAMANLIAGKKIVPELIQQDFTAANVVKELNKIIPEGAERQQMEAALKKVQERLRDSHKAEDGAMELPVQRASREILDSLKSGT